MRLNHLAVTALLLGLLATPAFAAVDYFEGWNVPDDPAGWIGNTVGTTVNVVNAGGNPGGYLHTSRTASFFDIGATTELADASGSYASVSMVSFDVLYIAGEFTQASFRVRYFDSTNNGWSFPLSDFTPGVWHSYSVPIDPTWTDAEAIAAGWVQDGPPSPSFAITMSDVYHPEVRLGGIGDIEAGIDNFRITAACPNQVAVLSANFDSDVAGTLPDATLPGGPTGDYLALYENSGTIRVENSFGTLINKPVVMAQVPGIGGLDLLAFVNDTPQCNQVRFSWSSLAASNDIFFMAMVVRDASALILGSVEYRPGGQLTYNSVGGVGPTLPVTYTPGVAQQFVIVVDVVNHTTSLSIDGLAIAGFQNVPYAEAGAGNPVRLGFEGGGIDAQTFAIDDIAASTCVCECNPDAVAPELQVVLDRDTLWPPNHKMAQVCATVTATDACDPNPTIALVSVTSDEPDNGLGDGDTSNDIEILPGNPPTCFNLRSERQGGGDGRTYTIVYSATDASGNTVLDTVEVNVPHDQGGGAHAATGFNTQGSGLMSGASEYALVVSGTTAVPARSIVTERAWVGNQLGFVQPTRYSISFVDGDNLEDLVLYYDTQATQQLQQKTQAENSEILEVWADDGTIDKQSQAPQTSTIALRYEANGAGYLVSDIFHLDRTKLPGSRLGDGTRPELPGGSLEPGSAGVSFALTIPETGSVDIVLFNVLGQKIRTLVEEEMTSGSHSVSWDLRDDTGRPVAGGMYFARILAPGHSEIRRIAVTR